MTAPAAAARNTQHPPSRKMQVRALHTTSVDSKLDFTDQLKKLNITTGTIRCACILRLPCKVPTPPERSMRDTDLIADASVTRVAVRELCEFSARAGDLDVRFGMSPNAREGVAGHLVVTSRRGADYKSEVTLKSALGDLLISGRADGYDATQNRLEEIKTFRGDLASQPANQRQLHWAQLKVYGWLLCTRDALPSITLALVYFNIDTQQEFPFEQRVSSDVLRDYFVEMCGSYSHWAQQERGHRARRDAYLSSMAFPHKGYRSGQRELAVAVFRAASAGNSLLVEAPTGIGKSIATLFPMLKAMPLRKLDKVYFLSAKSSGRRLATDALAMCANASRADKSDLPVAEQSHAVIRVVELIAKAKACLYPGKACTGSPLAFLIDCRLRVRRG